MFWLKKWRRNRIAAKKFPDNWLHILEKEVAIYTMLCNDDKEELKKHILIFLCEKEFEGCGGFTVTEREKIIIAANACILLLHRKTDYYPGLYSILVYPDAFVAPHKEYLPGGVVVEGHEILSGESWHRGTVILSWQDIEFDMKNIYDGRNVIYHEFAHQIDTTAGFGDSSAVLKTNAGFIKWSRVLYKNYLQLKNSDEYSILDEYGATNPAEFFAVSTECFLEKPTEMKQVHPELYMELMRFYNLDPSSFI